ncbi:MAG: FHA domain-containing protein [Deltaproteobacteria bacterium]
MPSIRIPSGTIERAPGSFTRKILEETLLDLCEPARDFTGFIAITSGDSLYLLFFFKNHPYSAGKSLGEKPFLLSLSEFFREVRLLEDGGPTISIHATDPVLLKCLLVFIQDNLTAKAPTSLINLEAILGQIQQEAADAMIILEKQGMFNFFFFKDGVRGKSYYADHEAYGDEGLSIDEQMLVYAYQGGDVDALIYRNITTRESTDAVLLERNDMLKLLRGEHDGSESESVVPEQEGAEIVEAEVEVIEEQLYLSVIDGPLEGKTLSGPIPCVLGRRDTDIILPDPMVSKTHAAIQVVNGKLLMIDLNSTNGTAVNGERIRQHEIAVGDIIGIGSSHLKVLRIIQP